MIKKRLAGNQVILAYMRKASNFSGYTVKPQIKAKIAGKTIKANAEVRLEKNGKGISLVFECVRRDLNWEQKFIDRMKLYKEFYDNFVQFDSGFSMPPQLIFVCEDEKHTMEVFRELVKNDVVIDKIKYYFTTDLKQNSTSLEKSLIEFVQDENGKYKTKNVEFKLLG
jgi:hypothetical protein